MELRHLLTGLGEKMSEEEVELLIHGKEDSQVSAVRMVVFGKNIIFTSQGNINYEEFVGTVFKGVSQS